jgi:outer membrane immunogenic protein
MKHALTAAVSSLLSVTAASAADLAAKPDTKAPAPVVAVYNWTGLYVGANGGGGWSHKCWTLTDFIGPVLPNQSAGCHDATGATAGGQIGYRWQTSNWVFGVEAQGNWANFRGSNVNLSPLGGGSTNATKIDSFGLFTGQVGYALNSVLLYVKGGAAVVSDKYNIQAPVTGINLWEGRETRWGATVGAGVEFGFAPNWSVALEYDHIFLGTQSVRLDTLPAFGIGGPLTSIFRIGQDVDLVTARVNYRFGGPVVARY